MAIRLGWPRGLAALGERDYRLYFVGHFTSQLGNWIENTAVSWILYELTDSALLLGIGGACRAVPIILLTLVGGAVADRFPRRPLLLATESMLLVLSLVVGALAALGHLAFWHLYLLNLASGTLAAFSVPARQALFPGLVPRETMSSAVMLNAAAVRVGGLIGPSIAGLTLATSGYAAPFVLNALTFLAMLGALIAMRLAPLPDPDPGTPRATLRRGMAEGLGFVWRNPVLRVVLGLELLAGLFGHNTALITIIARDVLDAGPQGLGLLLSALAAGSLLGLAPLVAVQITWHGRVILATGAAYALLLAGFGVSQSLGASAVLLFVLGAADGIWAVIRNSVAQLVVPDGLRGRVMAIVVLVTRGSTTIGQAQSGAVAAVAGGPAAALLGAAIVGSGVLAAVGNRAFRDYGGPAPPRPAASI